MHESSQYNYSNSSDDGQDKVLDRAKDVALKKMIASKNKTDQRFVDLIRVQLASRQGFKLGFNGLNFKDYEKQKKEQQ